MATCGNCMNRYSIDGTNELRCSVHMVSISEYSWCGLHDPQPSETEISKVELADVLFVRQMKALGEKMDHIQRQNHIRRKARVTDNPRSSEDIHD